MNTIPTESIILARIIGIFVLVCGISAIVKKKSWIEAVGSFQDNPGVINFIALAELAVGLIIFALHPHFVSNWTIIITIIGLLMVLESVCYLVFIPQKVVGKMVRFFNKPAWYNVCGVLSMVLGLYLMWMSLGFSR